MMGKACCKSAGWIAQSRRVGVSHNNRLLKEIEAVLLAEILVRSGRMMRY